MVKKEVVVIASVLKPVDDTRMYEKMAQSLASTGKFWVNILGFFSNTHSQHPDILFHPIFHFKRNHYRRILANIILYKTLKKIKPDTIITSTPELGPSLLLYCWRHPNTLLVYDVQENYQQNLRYHHTKYSTVRRWLSKLIDFWERKLATASDYIFVAEKGYYQEIPWLSDYPSSLLENKTLPGVIKNQHSSVHSSELSVLYTGTISSPYGIWDALRFVEQLYYALNHNLTFHLLGHVPQEGTYQELTDYLEKRLWIKATISQQPVPHQTLLQAMAKADFGIVSHQLLPSIRNCFPTRIWEYMAHKLPFFLQDYPPWVAYCQLYNCAIPVDFSKSVWPMESMINLVKNKDFYTRGIPEGIYWDQEGFLQVINDLTVQRRSSMNRSATTH